MLEREGGIGEDGTVLEGAAGVEGDGVGAVEGCADG